MNKPDNRVITGTVRLSYANVWEPRKSPDGGEPRYSASIIIDKGDTQTLRDIEKAVEAAILRGKDTKWGGKIPPRGSLKLPLRDGDEEREDEAYANAMFLNASSKQAPQIVDASVNPILDRGEVYSGVYARVSLDFYPFSANGNRGVAVSLGPIQKVRDGEPLGGAPAKASDVFGVFDNPGDDFLS